MTNNSTRRQAVTFIRVNHSTVGSDETYHRNVEWQRQQCQDYADTHGLTIIREYLDEGGGASLEQRPILREMLAELHALHNAAYVIATDQARISRRSEEMEHIRLQLEISDARLVCTKYAELSPTAQDAMTQLTATTAKLAEQDHRVWRKIRRPEVTGVHAKGATV